jgi:hypothetical protein
MLPGGALHIVTLQPHERLVALARLPMPWHRKQTSDQEVAIRMPAATSRLRSLRLISA